MLRATLLFLAIRAGLAQDLAAPALVREVIEQHQHATSLQVGVKITALDEGVDLISKPTLRFSLQMSGADRIRMQGDEATGRSLGMPMGSGGFVAFMHGMTLTMYSHSTNRYVVENSESGGMREGFQQLVIQVLPSHGAELLVDGAKLAGSAAIETTSGTIPCYLVRIEEQPGPSRVQHSYLWWIDKSTHRLLRAERAEVSTRIDPARIIIDFTDTAFDEPVPDDSFVFRPPPEATRVDWIGLYAR